MGEGAGVMNNSDIPVRHTDTAHGEESPEAIRAEIERTRAEMSETIDAIQERLSPEVLKTQAKEAIREATVGKAEQFMSQMEYTARSKGSSMWETIKHNPMPAALAGIGIGWLLMSSRKDDHEYHPRYQNAGREVGWRGAYGERYPIGVGYGEYRSHSTHESGSMMESGTAMASGMADRVRGTGEDLRHRTSDMASGVSDRAGHVAGQVADRADDLRHRAGDMASGVADRAGHVAGQVGERAYMAKDMMYENPMLMGAVALGLGALVGMILPETRKEHEWMGEAKENLVEKAKDKAMDAVQEARSQVVDKVVDTVQHVADDVKDRAEQAKDSPSTSSGQTNYPSGQRSMAA